MVQLVGDTHAIRTRHVHRVCCNSRDLKVTLKNDKEFIVKVPDAEYYFRVLPPTHPPPLQLSFLK